MNKPSQMETGHRNTGDDHSRAGTKWLTEGIFLASISTLGYIYVFMYELGIAVEF